MSKVKNQTKRLGKGLSALIEEINETLEPSKFESSDTTDKSDSHISILSVNQLEPGLYQPRRYFSEEPLRELSESIQKNGVMQPIVVRPLDRGQYQIIAGERRWRASKLAKLDTIPAIIRNLTDQEAIEFALIENIQREDLTPLEEALGYQRIIDEFNYTQEHIAEELGKSRSHIANMLRLLQLPNEIKTLLDTGDISMGHARALIKADNAIELAQTIIKKGLNVRQTENLIKDSQRTATGSKTSQTAKTTPVYKSQTAIIQHSKEKDEDVLAIEKTVSQELGLRVSIENTEKGGAVIIDFNTYDELDKILQKLSGSM